MNLSTIEKFERHEVLEIFVIEDDLNKEFEIFQLRASFFEDSNDSQKFFVINLIIEFDNDHFVEKVNY